MDYIVVSREEALTRGQRLLEERGFTEEETRASFRRALEAGPLATVYGALVELAYPDDDTPGRGITLTQAIEDSLRSRPLEADLPLTERTPLVLDATGVGRSVCDMFAGVRGLVKVTLTAGENVNREDGFWRVPKKDVVAVLQRLLQEGRLKFTPSLKLAPLIVKEMIEFRVRITAASNEVFGCWREGQNDDLVLAAGMVLWHQERGCGRKPVSITGEPRRARDLSASPLDRYMTPRRETSLLRRR